MLPSQLYTFPLTDNPSENRQHIIHYNVARYLERNGFLNLNQRGIRKGFSCQSQLAIFAHGLQHQRDA